MRISLFAAAVAERLIFYFFRRKRLKKKERYAIITIMSCRKREVTMQETTNLQKTMSIQACTERVQKIVAVSYPCAKAYVHSFKCIGRGKNQRVAPVNGVFADRNARRCRRDCI